MAESTASMPSKKKQKITSKSGLGGNHGPSKAWDYFNKIEDEVSKKYSGKAQCKYCEQVIDAPSRKGTNPAWTHVNKCKMIPKPEGDSSQTLISFKEGLVSWVFYQEKCRRALAIMIVIDELPFSIVEKEGFKKFCEQMQQRFHVVCRTIITKDCLLMFFQEKAKMKAYLKELLCQVCLTTDMWTSIQNLGYMVLTIHFVDQEWCLQKKIINFRVLPHPHTGEAMAKAIESCLLEWSLDKVMTITLDNAKSNDNCVGDLRRRLIKRNGLLVDGEFLQVRCFAHVTNLVVKVGIEEVQPTIKRLRQSMKYVRSSPSRLQAFKKWVLDENVTSKRSLCLDVKTRWNSTYLMINVALELEKAFECLKEDPSWKSECRLKGDGVLEDEDWKVLKALHTFLQEFYTLTKRISGSKYITSNTNFDELVMVKDLLMENMDGDDELFKKMASKMNDKFDKYCHFDSLNMILIVAIVLDPRFKIQYVEFCYSSYVEKVFWASSEEKKDQLLLKYKLDKLKGTRSEILEKLWEHHKEVVVSGFLLKLRNLMYQLFIHYKSEIPLVDEPMDTQGNALTDHVGSRRLTSKELLRSTLKMKGHVESLNDLDKYLNDNVVDEDGSVFNALAWWREKIKKYHALAFMARDVLTIPITSVASECAFSSAGRVLDPFRSSLTPTIVESLICTQDWLRSPISYMSVEEQLESLKAIEEVVLEELKALDIGASS